MLHLTVIVSHIPKIELQYHSNCTSEINLNGGIVSNKGFIRQMAAPGIKAIDGKYVSAWGGIQSAGQTVGQIVCLLLHLSVFSKPNESWPNISFFNMLPTLSVENTPSISFGSSSWLPFSPKPLLATGPIGLSPNFSLVWVSVCCKQRCRSTWVRLRLLNFEVFSSTPIHCEFCTFLLHIPVLDERRWQRS